MNNEDFSKVVDSYVQSALWASLDENGDPLDYNFDSDDLSSIAWNEVRQTVANFLVMADDLLPKYLEKYSLENLGHDLFLTQNGHGAGFWDRGLGELGDSLTSFAKSFGTTYIFLGDDEKLYGFA